MGALHLGARESSAPTSGEDPGPWGLGFLTCRRRSTAGRVSRILPGAQFCCPPRRRLSQRVQRRAGVPTAAPGWLCRPLPEHLSSAPRHLSADWPPHPGTPTGSAPSWTLTWGLTPCVPHGAAPSAVGISSRFICDFTFLLLRNIEAELTGSPSHLTDLRQASFLCPAHPTPPPPLSHVPGSCRGRTGRTDRHTDMFTRRADRCRVRRFNPVPRLDPGALTAGAGNSPPFLCLFVLLRPPKD